MTRHLPSDLAPEWRRAFAWIEAELGGRIVRAERQPRWRPAWFLDLERDAALVPLYFRGERGEADHGIYGLQHELRILQVLEGQGIPVPHVYAFCPQPPGIVMERCAGRVNLATAESSAERESVLDHYMEILVRMHRLDLAPFESLGLERPRTAEALALCDHERWERAYRRAKRRPEPAIEYLIRWVRRNVPRDRRDVAFICCDSGQFLFERGRVTALIDLELACLGDPIADLGGLRGRDLSEPLGDLARGLERYESLWGEPVDRAALDFHTVRFSLVTPLAVSRLVADPPPGFDLVQYLAWYLVWTRAPLEVIGARLGLELVPPELPQPLAEASPTAPAPDAAGSGADFEAYAQERAARQALYAARRAELGPELESQDLDDVARLLGRRPAGREEADRELEKLIESAGASHDADLVPYLYRRVLREESILDPVMRELRGARIQILP